MRIIECDQGTAAWFTARCGKPTASGFKALVTPLGAARKGAAPRAYALKLAAERLTGKAADTYQTEAMLRGNMLESEARNWYAFARGAEVARVGFIESDCGRWGCSPDALVGPDGGLEVKCYEAQHHIEACLDPAADEAIIQIQACLWVTGCAWWDFLMYSDAPGLPKVVRRIEPDATFAATFAEVLPRFCAEVDGIVKSVRGMAEPEPEMPAPWYAEGAQ